MRPSRNKSKQRDAILSCIQGTVCHPTAHWVYEELKRRIPEIDAGFMARMEEFFDNPNYYPKEKKLLRAAHYLATQWEFNIIYHFNQGIFGIEETRQAIAIERRALREYIAGKDKLYQRIRAREGQKDTN